MTKRLCKNIKVLARPYFCQKNSCFPGKTAKTNWKTHITCDKMNK